MSTFLSTIRPAPGADGPFYVVSEQDGAVLNVTTGVATILLALNQGRDDQIAAIQAAQLTPVIVELKTRTAG
jgi:hypothetical protein